MPHSSPIVRTRVLAAAVALACAAILTGCFGGPAQPVEAETPDVQGSAAEDQTPAEDAPATEEFDVVDLPADFPESVPLLDGPITSATSLKMGDGGYWDLHIRTSDSAVAMAEVRPELLAAGFAEQSWMEAGALVSGIFTSAELRVAVQSAKDIDGEMLMYTVTEL